MKIILIIIGTRPEAIKMAPLLAVLYKNKHFNIKVCLTRQHTDLLDPFLKSLPIKADYILENHPLNGCLYKSGSFILEKVGKIIEELKPDLLIVQGDTTSAFAGAMAAFYQRVPIAHVEAGLRTHSLSSPWPEEAHRCIIDKLSTYFFAPTIQARNTLIDEGHNPDKIWVVGNTSIDAARVVLSALPEPIKPSDSSIVVTIHRRENYDAIENICSALMHIGRTVSDLKILYILHPNPVFNKAVQEKLKDCTNIILLDSLDHKSFVLLLHKCLFIITDSGGIQEEAPFFGKPVLIARNTTERTEGILAGTAKLIGTESSQIIDACKLLLGDKELLDSMSRVHFPYGDGFAAERIASILNQELNGTN